MGALHIVTMVPMIGRMCIDSQAFDESYKPSHGEHDGEQGGKVRMNAVQELYATTIYCLPL